MTTSKLKTYFDRATNLAVIIAAIILVALFAKSYFFSSTRKPHHNPIKKGAILGHVDGIDLPKSVRTLVLALNTNCPYCTESLPFYKQLQDRLGQQTQAPAQLIALFSDPPHQVDSYVKLHQFSVPSISAVNYRALKIDFTPSLILVDSNGEVLESWDGKLSPEEQEDVYNAVTSHSASIESKSGGSLTLKQTVSLFDDNRPIAELRPDIDSISKEAVDDRLLLAVRRQINHFDVDPHGNVYLLFWDKIIKYDGAGIPLWSMKVPDGFGGAFCADDDSVYVPSKVGIEAYSSAGNGRLLISSAALPYSPGSSVLKMIYDHEYKAIYLQVYDLGAVSQTLFKLDLTKKAQCFSRSVPAPPLETLVRCGQTCQ